MRIGMVAGSYTARSTAVACEECINLFAETVESQGSVAPAKAYGGSTAQGLKNYFWTPGIAVFSALPDIPRGTWFNGQRAFAVAGASLVEVMANGTNVHRGAVASDALPASIVASSIELLVVSGGSAYCYELATDTLTDVTSLLAGVPLKVEFSDDYFIIEFKGSNKFQTSAILDGKTWPPLQVNGVSVFPENISSIIVNHRELWVYGQRHLQVYQNTGSDSVFDPIPGILAEMGCGATFSTCRIDNSVFWLGEDERGSRMVWRSQSYSPVRISTHAVETDLASYADVSNAVSYSYQDQGHVFWVLYIPGSQWSWCFDVGEGLWHKRAKWVNGAWQAHWGWNHMSAFGKHLIGDWNSGNLYEMSLNYLDDNSAPIRRLRRAPTVEDENARIFHAKLTLDFDTGLGPQPPLLDGDGNPRAPQVMLRWSDDRGKTWSNEHILDCGMAGQYRVRVIKYRLGNSRHRVYEISMSDPIRWTLVDAYLRVGA